MTYRILISALVSIMSAVSFQSGLAEENPKVARLIETLGYRPVWPPSNNIKLGGFLMPGHEEYGTVLASAVTGKFPMSIRRETIPIVQPASTMQSASSALWDGLKGTASCRDATIQISNWKSNILTIPVATRAEVTSFVHDIASSQNLPEEELTKYVVVTSTLSPTVSVGGCSTAADDNKLADQINDTVWGYQAAVAMHSMEGTGSELLLKVLSIFELNSTAKSRILRISSIDTQPSGAQVGWIDLVGTGGVAAATLPDKYFRWFASVPTPAQDLWAGKFFFRIVTKDGSETKQVDLTLSNDGQKLILPVSREHK